MSRLILPRRAPACAAVLARRAAVCVAVLAGILAVPGTPRAQAGGVPHRNLTFILPHYTGFWRSADLDAEIQALRTLVGDAGPRVRIGFTTYIYVSMSDASVAPTDAAAIRSALAPTFDQMDRAVLSAEQHGIAVCLSLLTTIRDLSDAVEDAGEARDRRNMQWYAGNELASRWSTYSRYARSHRRLQEAYMREVGRHLATLIAAHPDTVAAASGDGEVELAFDPAVQTSAAPTPETAVLADYSPFAVAEFRDWLTQQGLYAAGQPLAGQGWESSARYAGDSGPGIDSNGDGHTLNGDFGTGFDTWRLKYFDWTLDPAGLSEPGAIPRSTYTSPGWTATPAGNDRGFDPPRAVVRGDGWWELWNLFRQRMVWRHNLDVARWMTTSADGSGATVPPTRWYSDQIPADYLFGFTPTNPDLRLFASGSPWWTADVRPYGGAGLTAFGFRDRYSNYFPTLPGVFPRIVESGVRWGLFEWNPLVTGPGDPAAHDDPAPYRRDTDLIAAHRPGVLAPFTWNNPDYPVRGTGFETALRELGARLGTEPLTLSPGTLEFGMTATGSARTPPQIVRVSGAPGERPAWFVQHADPGLSASLLPDGRSFSVSVEGTLPVGVTTRTVVIASNDPSYRASPLTVVIRVPPAAASAPPAGTFDTPVQNAVVTGEIGVTGWAVDDIGVAGVDIYRSPVAGERGDASGLVPVGTATLVAGARPDVQAAFPTRPLAERAGWGYMLLTNMLPGGGNGVFTLHAFARDFDGHATLLGSRTVTARNNAATLPFGTIDTPLQGETVSGTIVNFGWALTPQPAMIPVNGSTIGVYIDGIYAGHPVYGNARADIQQLFPGYANTGGAVGYFTLDTTQLANGVHTIEWGVSDDHGNAQGIGSRYFTVNNP